MNIKVQCCGIVILLTLLLFYLRRRKIHMNTEKAFLRLFFLVMAGVSLDILSLVALYFNDVWNPLIVNAICKAYLISLITLSYFAFLYIVIDIYNRDETYRFLFWVATVADLIGTVCVIILPIKKELSDPQAVYTYGPSVMTTYGFAFSLLLASVILLIKGRRRMDHRRFGAVLIWLCIWIGAAAVQFINNRLLLVGFSGAIGMMVMFLKLENPEISLDRESGMFNSDALSRYLDQLYKSGKSFSVLEMLIVRRIEHYTTEEEEVFAREEMCRYLMDIPKCTAFSINENDYIFIFDNSEIAEEYEKIISSRFEFGWGEGGDNYMTPAWVFMPVANTLNRAKDVVPVLRYARRHSAKFMSGDTIIADEVTAASMYDERHMENLIEDAIENDRVEVFFQPIYNVKKQKFTSAEALVRIRNEEGKIVPPGSFIEVAENNGMIMQLGEIVFEKVCKFLRDDKPMRYGIEYIEVNLSAVQCGYQHLASNYIRIMEKYQIDPEWINLEITESASMGEKQIFLGNMAKLMAYGATFSLDDFGTGQSNLNYIVEMPVEIVKFDRSMVGSYFENGRAKYVMDAAIYMIRGMNLPIVSEGIETEEQLTTMKQLGISYIQGFFFSKPLPENEFMDFLIKHNVA